ncbi:MAG TPA: BREX system P-loop protein BrxC [Solirubrobacterales bacterium]|nr:BREX system P-loop protein BrxC [Solirubrobacterales bacterium]
MKNRDLFYRDPVETQIPNGGVAQVGRPQTDQEWEVLRWELTSFVCDGQYEQGLDRILGSFLNSLRQPHQPAAWVSGFFGSGKSHLVRVLEYLWRDIELPSGERARDLVSLSDEVRDQLTELSTQGKRAGGLWSAAGTLAAGRSEAPRLAFLSVLFESAGLPKEFAQARFTIWARENGYLEAIEAAVEAEGRTLEKEIYDLYVSPVIARALLAADPTLAASVEDVRALLQAQFPPATQDVSEEMTFEAMSDVLRLQSESDDDRPLTLIVLDEMQQYIGDDNDKALVVQNIVEGCSARFGSQILFVATGQSALTATPTLQRLIDRFTVPVVLSDNDVETVVRKVVLRKKPEHMKMLESTMDAAAGEIDRHLGGTRYAPRAEEKSKLVPDYPVLPNRWRLWSEMLRAVDRGGKSGLVRSQLGLIHGGLRFGADRPVGSVIGADYLFFDDKARIDMLMNGVLLREVDDFIQQLVGEGGDGIVKGRLCALIFLMTQMSQPALGGEGGSGLRPTASFLSDLLVEDLVEDGPRLRRQVPELLEELIEEGRIVQVGDEYRLLTQEDAEWDKEYRSRLAAIRDDAAQINRLRGERLEAAVEAALRGLSLRQGASMTPRKLQLRWELEEPKSVEGEVPVWVRDEWAVQDSAVKRQAAEAGDESPTVFVLLPKHEPDQIRETLASHAAAEDTLRRPTPQTDEGRAAQGAMKTRLAAADARLQSLFQELVGRARVFQGGGVEMTVTSLSAAVETAANRSLVRLFPRSAQADHPDWSKVVERARDGAPDALAAVGHQGAATTNSVCKEVLAAIGPAGTKGGELQKRFAAPPYGWRKDAVNGAVLVLLLAGNIRAAQDGKDLGGPKELLPSQIGKVTLYKEDDPPSVEQRLAVKGLLTAAGIGYEEGKEGAEIAALLQRMKDLASRAGGPPPLPEPPSTDHLEALLGLGGNARFKAVADEHDRLAADLGRWKAAAEERERRELEWDRLERLQRHAAELPVSGKLGPAIAAVLEGRLLLADPDPIAPLLAELVTALREAVVDRAQRLAEAQREAVGELERWDGWAKLEEADRRAIVEQAKLVAAEPPRAGNERDLLELLDADPLRAWGERIDLVASRREQARQRAAKKLEPESVAVPVPHRVVKSRQDLDDYVEELRAKVEPHLDRNQTVIL